MAQTTIRNQLELIEAAREMVANCPRCDGEGRCADENALIGVSKPQSWDYTMACPECSRLRAAIARANARLMASSPDLLAALTELVELEFGEGVDGQPLTHRLDTAGYYALEQRMRAAIARATA